MSKAFELDKSKFGAFKEQLTKLGFKFEKRQYQVFLARYDKFTVNLYESGKVTFGGSDKELQQEVEWFLGKLGGKAPEVQKKAGFEGRTRIGTDEVGKGDFFGPLVVAGALLDKEAEEKLAKLGVKDSKEIKGDRRIMEMAEDIAMILGSERYEIISINPSKYNELYAKMENLNIMLGWGHARAIENLLRKNEGCELAISDQFGDPDFIASSLMEKGKTIELIQITKGGRDLAVATASVLARAKFVSAMEKMSGDFGFEFPKGASAKVVEAAKEFISTKGVESLGKVAKLHFSMLEDKR
jgi:ribonuclease HIII